MKTTKEKLVGYAKMDAGINVYDYLDADDACHILAVIEAAEPFTNPVVHPETKRAELIVALRRVGVTK